MMSVKTNKSENDCCKNDNSCNEPVICECQGICTCQEFGYDDESDCDDCSCAENDQDDFDFEKLS